jgi:hypothetical protein
VKVTWHPTLTDSLTAAWDERWQALDLHPLQHRSLAEARAKAYGQGLLFALGHENDALVFGAAVQVRRSGPWPPRFAVQRGPWAVDQEHLLAGMQQMIETRPPGRRPMTLRIDPHAVKPCDDLEQRLVNLGFATVSAELHQQTIVCDLTTTPDERRKSYRTLTRRMLKKAASLGLVTSLGDRSEVEAYLTMHRRAAGAKGYGVPDERWLMALLDSGAAWLVLTRQEDRLVGGGMFALGSHTVHYLYGATDPDFDGPALYDTFEWVIQRATDDDRRRFDLGGLPSDDDGVAFFKRGWGGQKIAFSAEGERVLRPWADRTWQVVR